MFVLNRATGEQIAAEKKEIVEKIGDRASFSLFKFDNHHEGETDTVLQYQYNLYQKG